MCTDRIQSATGTAAAQKLALSLPASHTNINEITNSLVPKVDKSIYNIQIITGEILGLLLILLNTWDWTLKYGWFKRPDKMNTVLWFLELCHPHNLPYRIVSHNNTTFTSIISQSLLVPPNYFKSCRLVKMECRSSWVQCS